MAQILQGVPIDLFFSILNAKKQPKNLEVTKNQRIFAKGFKRLYYDNIRVTK